MRDPMTLAFQIKNPFIPVKKSRRADGTVWSSYRPALIDIWHVDPETDGSDDSCGWFGPNLTKDQLKSLRFLAQDEARHPWFQAHDGKAMDDPVRARELLDGAIYATAMMLRLSYSGRRAEKLRTRLLHDPHNNIRGLLAYKSGYHGNSSNDAYWREENAMSLFTVVAKAILRDLRPRWKHPRWHVHHWKVNVIPVRNFKRWAFSRCCKCGGRFPYNYAPVSTSWYGTGPRWFRSEEGIHHHDCRTPKSDNVGSVAA